MSCCANHTCGKSLKDGGDKNVLCPLCVDAELPYCSEQCRVMDWMKHKCDNAMLIKGPVVTSSNKMTMFVPYHFEDMLTEKEHKRLADSLEDRDTFELGQRYLVQVHHADQTVSQHITTVDAPVEFQVANPKKVPVFRRGVEPPAALRPKEYEVQITVPSHGIDLTMKGVIGKDSIFDKTVAGVDQSTKNPFRRFSRWVLNKSQKESTDTVLFTKPPANRDIKQIMFPIQGVMTVVLRVDGNIISQMEGPYNMPTKGTQFTRALGKAALERLRMLFPGRDDAVKDMKMLRGQESDMHESVTLIFKVPRTKEETKEENRSVTRMALQGVIFTVPSDNMELYAAGGQRGASVLSGKPPPPPKNNSKAEEPAVVAPPSRFSPEEDAPPPPPPSDDDKSPPVVNNNSSPSSSPEIGGGEFVIPASPPLPPASARSSGGTVRAGGASKSKPTPLSPRTQNDNGLSDSFLVEKAKREAILNRRSSLAGEDGDGDDWKTEAQIGHRQILFSPAGISVPIECDASNLAHITGLAMALEYRAAIGDALLQTPDMEHVTSIIQQYARNHPKESVAEVPLDVSTAIYTALDTLTQQGY